MIWKTDKIFSKRAFTLTEMLLVTAIAAMLVMLVVPAFGRRGAGSTQGQIRDFALLCARAKAAVQTDGISRVVELSEKSDYSIARIYSYAGAEKIYEDEVPLKLDNLHCYYLGDTRSAGLQSLPFEICFSTGELSQSVCVRLGGANENEGMAVIVSAPSGGIRILSAEKLTAGQTQLEDIQQYWLTNSAGAFN